MEARDWYDGFRLGWRMERNGTQASRKKKRNSDRAFGFLSPKLRACSLDSAEQIRSTWW